MTPSQISIKTAAIATGLNIFLTIVKFTLYSFSGSLAVLAEAWHSLTDIATSVLVLIAVKRSSRKREHLADGSEDFENGRNSGDEKHRRIVKEGQKVVSRLELFVSLGIGVMLMLVGAGLLRTFLQAETYVVENALISGILFILFSFCSYFVSRFETKIGKKVGSLGLVSDGMHARADMAASLITGIALILCAMGLNLDRWVAGVIALFILIYAFETIINVVLFYFREDHVCGAHADTVGQSHAANRANAFKITTRLREKSIFRPPTSAIAAFLGNRPVNGAPMKGFFLGLLSISLIALFSLYLSTSVYGVDTNEEALVERFGKPLNPSNPVQPGLHLKLPWPFDRVRKLKTKQIEEIHIGNRSPDRAAPLLWTRQHGMEEPFLSGDNNLFYPYITLHYRVSDIYDYLYRNRDTKGLVKVVAQQLTTAQFAGKKFYDIAGKQRKQLERDIISALQLRLDALQCGVEIVYLCLKDIHPPISVADAFEKVIAGFQEKQNVINQANGFRNQILPETRGRAAQEIEQAHSYIIEKTEKTTGDARRLELSRPDTRQEKDIMMSQTYFQTMQDVLKGKTKYVIDPKAGTPDIWTKAPAFPDYFSEEDDFDAYPEGEEL